MVARADIMVVEPGALRFWVLQASLNLSRICLRRVATRYEGQ